MIHRELKEVPVMAEFPGPGIALLFTVCQLLVELSAALRESGVLSFKVSCRQKPLSAALPYKQKSPCNECVMAVRLQRTERTDVPYVPAVHQLAVVSLRHLQSSLFGAPENFVMEKK